MNDQDLDQWIPSHIRKLITSSGSWAEGDTWMLGNGRRAEYHMKRKVFTLTEKGPNGERVFVADIPFARMVNHLRPLSEPEAWR